MAITWIKPYQGLIKLKYGWDFSRNLGISGGVGIVRDFNDDLILAFSECFGVLTSLQAEVRALLV